MSRTGRWDRRTIVKAAGAGMVAALGGPLDAGARRRAPAVKGNIKQSVCRWCYGDIPLEKLAAEAKRIGYQSIELVTPQEFPTVKAAGLTCAMLSGACTIEDCFNRKENHDRLETALREHIEFAAANGLPNVICFSGNRRGMSDEEGLENCAAGLKRIVGLAEQKKVTICMELLNSKVESQGLHVRPHGLGRGAGEEGRLAAVQAALRHLPHADHGRRRDPHDPATTRTTSATTTPAATRAGTRSTRRRSSTTRPS